MLAGPEKFVLRSTLTSPFGRKVRMAIELLGLGDRITLVPANPLDEKDTLRGLARFKALTLARLADGILDASILIIYDSRFRPGEPPSERWLAHQRGKIDRGLAAFQSALPDPRKTDIVSIGLSCALGYLDWRKQVDWRPVYPGLVEWLKQFSGHEPAFDRTRAPAS